MINLSVPRVLGQMHFVFIVLRFFSEANLSFIPTPHSLMFNTSNAFGSTNELPNTIISLKLSAKFFVLSLGMQEISNFIYYS